MSERSVFEAWARVRHDGSLWANDAYDVEDELNEYDYEQAAIGECEWVRVRVTVEVIEPDDGPQEAA